MSISQRRTTSIYRCVQKNVQNIGKKISIDVWSRIEEKRQKKHMWLGDEIYVELHVQA